MTHMYKWVGLGLAAGAILANTATYIVFPLGTPFWTVLGVAGGYLAAKSAKR